jgi:hypothetical protein
MQISNKNRFSIFSCSLRLENDVRYSLVLSTKNPFAGIINFYQNLSMWFSKQETICENPEFTVLNEDFEQIFDEHSGEKAMVLQEV